MREHRASGIEYRVSLDPSTPRTLDPSILMKERIVALGFVLFALVFLAGSLPLKVGTPARPGAGFMPAVVGACLLVAAAYNLFR